MNGKRWEDNTQRNVDSISFTSIIVNLSPLDTTWHFFVPFISFHDLRQGASRSCPLQLPPHGVSVMLLGPSPYPLCREGWWRGSASRTCGYPTNLDRWSQTRGLHGPNMAEPSCGGSPIWPRTCQERLGRKFLGLMFLFADKNCKCCHKSPQVGCQNVFLPQPKHWISFPKFPPVPVPSLGFKPCLS